MIATPTRAECGSEQHQALLSEPLLDAPRAPTASLPRRLWQSVFLALLAGCLIVAHGCHSGDHDDELLIVLFDRGR